MKYNVKYVTTPVHVFLFAEKYEQVEGHMA